MTLTAVLLAGGESRRMGRDKALVEFNGQPLWQRQLETLRQVGATEIIVSARTDPAWRPNDLMLVADGIDSHGPWSGLMASLAYMRTTHLLALAIDMPMMRASYLHSLGELVETDRGVVPQIGECYEPLAAIYPRGVDVDLARAGADGDYSLQNALERLIANDRMRAVKVERADEELFRNVNRPRDLPAADHNRIR